MGKYFGNDWKSIEANYMSTQPLGIKALILHSRVRILNPTTHPLLTLYLDSLSGIFSGHTFLSSFYSTEVESSSTS